MTVPRGLVRLQFDAAFPLDAAVALVDYFADLGASHIAASPILASRPDLHGGVVDHDAVEPRIGGEEALRRLSAALRRRQMGLIVDVTPAAMAVGGDDNAIWRDLLEWGRDSAYTHWFDVDWRGSDPSLRNTLLAPFLDQPYGVALEAGTLQLAFDGARGAFLVRHRAHAFPICPLDYAQVLEAGGLADAGALAAPFARLAHMRPDAGAVDAARQDLMVWNTVPEGKAVIAAAIGAFDARTASGATRLHRLLERQNYRLAWWGTAADALNWTRLPDTTALAALRTERPDVFDATHATLVRLYAEGLVDGFVIRQWDLLADPAGYARRLGLKLEAAAAQRPPGLPALYLVADAEPSGETPPAGWGVAGTAGAEAQEALVAVLHDAAGASALSDLWIAATGERLRPNDQRAGARRQALDTLFGAQRDAVVQALHEVALIDLKTRDITPAALARIVSELAVAVPVRRTYAGRDGFDAADAALFDIALARARRRLASADAPAAGHVARWLGGETPRQLDDFEEAGAREHAIAAFQQLTAALARIADDEMLPNRHARLVSREAGACDPARIGLSEAGFHACMAARAAHGPNAVTATGGPDQRRGEDARMRIAVLAEAPRDFEEVLRRLLEITRPFRTRLPDGVAPEPADAVMLLQTLIGAWPPALRPDDPLGLGDLHDRLKGWWLKAVRSARRRTAPVFGDAGYEQGCAQFLTALLESPAGAPARQLIADILPALTRAGAVSALSQAVLKCTVPGVPELFQGTEFWDCGLGAADGARPVDYLARAKGLSADARPDQLLETWQDGRVKQATLARLLHLRAAAPALFREGGYLPLHVEGAGARHALAFARRHREACLVTVVTRLPLRLLGPEAGLPKVPPARWSDTVIAVPDAGLYRDALTGRALDGRHGRLAVSDVLHAFPAAVLLKT